MTDFDTDFEITTDRMNSNTTHYWQQQAYCKTFKTHVKISTKIEKTDISLTKKINSRKRDLKRKKIPLYEAHITGFNQRSYLFVEGPSITLVAITVIIIIYLVPFTSQAKVKARYLSPKTIN